MLLGKAGIVLMLSFQFYAPVDAEDKIDLFYLFPHPVSIYSEKKYDLKLKDESSPFTHWQLRSHGGLIVNGRVINQVIELTVPKVTSGGGFLHRYPCWMQREMYIRV